MRKLTNTSSPVPASSLPPSSSARCAFILPIQRIAVARALTICPGNAISRILKDSQGFSRIKCRGDSPCHRHLLQFLPTAAESLFLACRIRCNGQNVHFNKLSLQMLRIRSNTNNQGPENDFVIMSYHISIWGKTSDQMNFEMSNFFTVKILIRDAFKIYSS